MVALRDDKRRLADSEVRSADNMEWLAARLGHWSLAPSPGLLAAKRHLLSADRPLLSANRPFMTLNRFLMNLNRRLLSLDHPSICIKGQ